MKGLSTLSSVLFALFLAAACGDDDDSTQTETKCQYPYTDRTATTLKAATTSGACAADTATICNTNMVMTASGCGVSCNAEGGDVATCTKTCIQNTAMPKPSDGCTTCYVADVACSIQNCLTDCAQGATAACNTCRVTKGCTAAFYSCSGLPVPTIAGTGGGGNSTGGKGNTSGGAPGAGNGGEPSTSGGTTTAMGGQPSGTSGAGGDTGTNGGGGSGGVQ